MDFLFWNIKKKDTFIPTIQAIAQEEDIDVFAFAEFPSGCEAAFETGLRQVAPSFKYLNPIVTGKIEIFYKDGSVNITPCYHGERIKGYNVASNVVKETFLLFFTHVWSKANVSEKQQNYRTPFVVKEITDHENTVQNYKTIVCGDFNMDVFQDGMLMHNGFNAMMTSHIALQGSRRVNKQDFNMFYNPMWGLYGDVHGREVAGTYFYRVYEPVVQYWHMYDQVIMRPSVIPYFDKQALKIVAKGINYNLLTGKGVIDIKYSDHLPIKFKLNI